MDAIWKKVEQQVASNKKETQSSSDKAEAKKTTTILPKTGEKRLSTLLIGLGILLISTVAIIKFKSNSVNN
ncbi:LPXTG cell wall anchor domain-containing protein [Enterococcus sp. AZ194]|uniref:LPXTG cell wall anchor domain-containing protein n=1 Tax=Enterococcus sp. AZ194 TaxID=2774629 RepID=UPI003F682E44